MCHYLPGSSGFEKEHAPPRQTGGERKTEHHDPESLPGEQGLLADVPGEVPHRGLRRQREHDRDQGHALRAGAAPHLHWQWGAAACSGGTAGTKS